MSSMEGKPAAAAPPPVPAQTAAPNATVADVPAAPAAAPASTAGVRQRKSTTTGGTASPRRVSMTLSQEATRIEEMVEIVPYLRKAAPVIGNIAVFVNRVAPVFVKMYATAFHYFRMLPQDLMMVVFGLALCFFGGVYPAAIAAVEAFRMYGWENTRSHLTMLWEEHQALMQVNSQDNGKDEDGNGVADVDEVSGKQLFTRKLQLFLAHANPERMNAAVGGLWHATLGVIGVLKIQFARTVTLGAAIGDVTSKTVGRAALPVITHLLPEQYRKWVPVLVNWVCKCFGMMVAWTVQRILSAAHSAVRGGYMAARHALAFIARHQGVKFNPDESYLDEIAGFVLAAMGIYVQFSMGFGLPFLVNIILFPVSCLEYVIEYMVSS